ncbi:unnamed protein product [Peronospora farinosa]|uniref:Pyridine nucleotide-disulphide oxidoreductase dimerisation domain-containing protein n=1 Tax=Peronospora farinosa TaxID=134698 RepID=A0AAV0U8B5_9STRA|nr:unnamed protein product [Peronospora farinosa]CAI5733231.1 unnamed protein product [Peronospora farinosa]
MANSRARMVAESDGLVKVLLEKKMDKLICVLKIASNACEMVCHRLEDGATDRGLTHMCDAYPTLNEAFKEAFHTVQLSQTLEVVEDVNHMTIVSSKQETERSNLLLALERDVYYCYLVPLTIPVTILACYANWVSLKFFRHN